LVLYTHRCTHPIPFVLSTFPFILYTFSIFQFYLNIYDEKCEFYLPLDFDRHRLQQVTPSLQINSSAAEESQKEGEKESIERQTSWKKNSQSGEEV
jgi:hypothetical protein